MNINEKLKKIKELKDEIRKEMNEVKEKINIHYDHSKETLRNASYIMGRLNVINKVLEILEDSTIDEISGILLKDNNNISEKNKKKKI